MKNNSVLKLCAIIALIGAIILCGVFQRLEAKAVKNKLEKAQNTLIKNTGG